MKNDPVVSVLVICYNHEKYLEQCLNGILSQKTDYPFEVIIHDDASSDNSQEIIKRYEKEYPDIIRTILQKENQFSKGVPIVKSVISHARGRYIMICESDDYWTDEKKLQIQTDFMINNPDYSMCCHSAKVFLENQNEFRDFENCPLSGDCDIDAETMITMGGGVIATASVLYKKEYGAARPDYCMKYGVSDYPMMIFLAIQGKVRYFDRKMTVYRLQAKGSWSDIMLDLEKKKDHILKMDQMLRAADEYHHGKYHDSFEKRILINDFELAYLKKDWDEMLKRKYSHIFKEQLGESQGKLRIKMKLKKLLGKNQG